MELKSPVKKGFKTPHYRPPLPILNECSSGLCVDEYDWPTFNGYYNGTSVIVDDSRAIAVLTNKGFFGKGSLSKGCPNVSKRSIPNNVVYESQWKRRKQWIEKLNILLKSKDSSNISKGPENMIWNQEDLEQSSTLKNETDKTSIIQYKNSSINYSQEKSSNVKKVSLPLVVDSDGNKKDIVEKYNVEDENTDQSIIEPQEMVVVKCSNCNKEIIENTFKENLKDISIICNEDIEVDNGSSEKFHNNQLESITKMEGFPYTKEKGPLNANEVLVIADIGNDLEHYFNNLNPRIEEEKLKTAIEVLYLSLEEAFFLSHACNCLQIIDLHTNILRIKDMWILFQDSQHDFIEKYIAYHYFRAKGWVVKSGTKFGGDFLLYKKGPLYFHASYIVIVEVLKNNRNNKNKMTWQKMIGINRMAESATKELLICHIVWPDVEKEKFKDPSILKEFRVSETLLRRWQATQEKTV